MELIKKIIKQALTTGTTESCTGHCRVIIPDVTAVYHATVLLTSKALDLGFFDTVTAEEAAAVTTTTTTQAPVETFYALTNIDGIFLDDNNDKFEWK